MAHQAPQDLPDFDNSARFKLTKPPGANWTYAQPTTSTPEGAEWVKQGEEAGFKVIDPRNTDVRLYPLLVSGIVPRPIGFVSTRSADGVDNLAPFSWFNQVVSDPPLISLSIGTPSSGENKKDTTRNILETKEFTVNIISEPFMMQANSTSLLAPFEISEWDVSGLTQAPSEVVRPARVKESAFSLECSLYQHIPITHPEKGNIETATIILGRIERFHVRNDVLTAKGTVDFEKLRPATRLGDISYGRVLEGYRIPRPDWEGDKEEILRSIEEEKKKKEKSD